ncbi:hypothetical protein A2714_02010 [Candidatus Woesebacteria bacterium RIFCSPHIGHO2_01_FULL_38_9]|uniref:Pseudouridine synthase n=2 Tax=Candidatus Woeseibacteriota TaxID=1752722 RepID=A0A1F7Y1B2_9BACT|nr:MAG: hypothetical protein A2714_02010 [Candidatus Woesebacteria bacterium RIFCSPHIGHO2_01_FULL_38_9]OGM60173.1 MAG: hypothetical protein A3A75_05735 [Candidatus Woesebacteria bacterium RIFCSPLOWO2_01_FULL_39_10]
MEPKIIFEDDSILILDKPAGWIVNESETVGKNPVIQSWIKENFNFQIAKALEYRSGIVHRLDKETSGILVVAKTPSAFANLQSQFKERKVKKRYSALVHGIIEPKSGTISAPVGRLPWNRKRFGVLPGGREAATRYRVISNFQFPISKEVFTLLELYPETGRTHQIRIHTKYLGHPIVSDEFYAGRKTSRRDRTWCKRLFLHATGITFYHPESKEAVSFQAKLPQDLASALNKISLA